jgi:hypothetical protein
MIPELRTTRTSRFIAAPVKNASCAATGTIDNAFWSNPLDALQDRPPFKPSAQTDQRLGMPSAKGWVLALPVAEQELSSTRDRSALAKEDEPSNCSKPGREASFERVTKPDD